MTNYVIPTTGQVPQRFRVALGSTTYLLSLHWNKYSRCWLLDIADTDARPIIHSIPLLPNTDLLGQFDYLDIGGQLAVVVTQGPPDAAPDFYNLGLTNKLVFRPDA